MAPKILIVEDNPDLSELLAFCLHDAGYETSRARYSAQGISKALAERPDLIITDLHLPASPTTTTPLTATRAGIDPTSTRRRSMTSVATRANLGGTPERQRTSLHCRPWRKFSTPNLDYKLLGVIEDVSHAQYSNNL